MHAKIQARHADARISSQTCRSRKVLHHFTGGRCAPTITGGKWYEPKRRSGAATAIARVSVSNATHGPRGSRRKDSLSVRLPEFMRTTTFRWTIAVFGLFAATILVSFAHVYQRTTSYLTAQIDAFIAQDADALAGATPEDRLRWIEERLRQDPRHGATGQRDHGEGMHGTERHGGLAANVARGHA